MKSVVAERNFYKNKKRIIESSRDKTIYKIEWAEGWGNVTVYHIFSGIDLVYNDFNAFSCIDIEHPAGDIIEINHCRRGRFGCQVKNDSYIYLGEGDLEANTNRIQRETAGFPLGYYEGLEVLIDVEKAKGFLSTVMEDISIDLDKLKEKLFSRREYFILRKSEEIEHIIHELYNVDERIQRGYFKLKVLELLLFFTIVPEEDTAVPYFRKALIDKAEHIKEHLIEDLEKDITLEELAKEHEIGLTSLKKTFKGIYGKSIYVWRREYKIYRAAEMLTSTKMSVAEIAGKMGYDNPSKFASVFKKQMGVSPSEYRKK